MLFCVLSFFSSTFRIFIDFSSIFLGFPPFPTSPELPNSQRGEDTLYVSTRSPRDELVLSMVRSHAEVVKGMMTKVLQVGEVSFLG